MERLPPVMETSASTKSVDDSERVKVREAVSPALKEETSELTAMVGLTLSTEKVTELLASVPSLLVLPAESENFELATEITSSEVLLSVGVKMAGVDGVGNSGPAGKRSTGDSDVGFNEISGSF